MLTSVEQQLQTAGSESHSDIRWTAVLSPWPVPENWGLDLTQWTCFVSYQDNGCDCWKAWAPVCSPYSCKRRKVKDMNVFNCLCTVCSPLERKPAVLYFIFHSKSFQHMYLCLSLCGFACLHCSLLYVGLIVLLAAKKPLIVVTKTSGSYSHSNKNISFPRAEFINYAFLLQDLYFLRQELECMLNFLLSTRAAPPTASPLQLLPRQLIEKCSVAWRILIHSYPCSHNKCWQWFCVLVCVWACTFMCARLHLVSWTILKHSQCNAVLLLIPSHSALPPLFFFILHYYCESKRLHIICQPMCLCLCKKQKEDKWGKKGKAV